MFNRFFLLICCCGLSATASRAQCPDKEEVRNQVILLKNTVADPAERLRQMLRYDSLVSRCPCRNDSSHELLLRRIAAVYNSLGNYSLAALYYTRANQVILDNYKSIDINRRQLLSNFYHLSEIYALLHNLPEKRNAENRCIEIALLLHMSADISAIRCLYARVEYLFGIGDYARCATDAQDCERLSAEYLATPGSALPVGEGFVASSHGWCVESLLRLQRFEEVEQLLTDNAATYKKIGLTNYLPLIYSELAQVEMHKHNSARATAYFNQALQAARAMGKPYIYKQTLKSIGEDLYFNYFHDQARALEYYREALRHNRPPEERKRLDSLEDASIFNDIANIYTQQNRFDSAFVYFGLAFNQVKPGADETGILNNSKDSTARAKIHYLAGMLIDKGDACRTQCRVTGDKNALREAVRIYRVADQLLGHIDAVQSDLGSRLFWRSDTRRLYEHAIDVCWLQGNDTAAFYFFEKSRAIVLNDQLLEQRLQGGEAISRRAELLRTRVQQDRELEALAAGSPRYKAIKTAQFASRQELDSLERTIAAHDPLYYQGFIDHSNITLTDLRNSILKDHSGLLELFYGDSAVYILQVTGAKVWLQRIDRAAYDRAVTGYLSFLADPDLLNRHLGDYVLTAHRLYDLLFHDHPLPPGRIIVSPDGRTFPLEALVSNTDDKAPLYLLSNYAVSYTYSAHYLQNDFTAGETNAVSSFLGVAPVQYKPAMQLTALQGSDRSLETISGYFSPSLNLLSGEATKDRFRNEFFNYRVIQLYTHSCDSSSNKEPVIYFADSELYLSDLIPGNKPATQLIVLSACETANGRFYRGEGVFSFNRGFAALGIPSSVSNLWSIDNTATYTITELFYKYLSQHLPIDLALQKAKLEFIQTADSRDKRLPYYWAASIVIGKTDPIGYPRPSAWPWVAAGALLLLLLLFLAWRRHRKPVEASNDE